MSREYRNEFITWYEDIDLEEMLQTFLENRPVIKELWERFLEEQYEVSKQEWNPFIEYTIRKRENT